MPFRAVFCFWRRMKKIDWRIRWTVALALLTLVVLPCWFRARKKTNPQRVPRSGDPSLVLVTGYCNCGKCCGWEYSWVGFGKPVYTYGSMKGKPKDVGITARGTVARKGTIAADPKVFRFGTKIDVPGYGVGVVEDIGGAIQGRHIDVWFPTHEEARRWGSKWLKLKVL